MTEEITVSEPITAGLRDLDEWKRVTQTVMRDGEQVDYVTAEFHEAFVAEMRARWQLDITRLEDIHSILKETR